MPTALTSDEPLSNSTRIMGVVNVTPDSFSDGGLFLDADAAARHARELVAEGADLLDVGGESTRPGAEPVTAEEEIGRVGPVLDGLVGAGVPISIDTSKAAVAADAIERGASIVNDVTALSDPEMGAVCAETGVEVCLMHMQGEPRTMQAAPAYGDVVDDVKAYLAERIEVATAAGIAEQKIWVDPGIGFGKALEHNLELLRRLGELRDLGRPIVIGTSRKSFIGKITGREAGDRLGGTVASNVLALASGADIFRVHDVKPMREALKVAEILLGHSAWQT